MHILLTAFEPFGTYRVNPTQLIVKALIQDPSPTQALARQLTQDPTRSLTLSSCHLPVDLACVEQALAAYHQCQPDAVLSLGLGHGAALALERIAINLDDFAIPDNAGVHLMDQPIVPDGPIAYWSTLPLRAMLSHLHQARIPATLSYSAGTYLCNHLFYALCHQLRETRIPYGFIHVPCLPEQMGQPVGQQQMGQPVDPSLPLDVMIQGIQICLAVMVQHGS